MNSSHTGRSWRAFGKAILAIAFVLVLFFSALASANPSLHDSLHKDHQAHSHYCLVTILEHGQTDSVDVLMAVLPVIFAWTVSGPNHESFLFSYDLTLHPERGPPAVS